MKHKCGIENINIVMDKEYIHYCNGKNQPGIKRSCISSLVKCSLCGKKWRTSANYLEKIRKETKA
ncbi:MAG: hypothetical protein OEV44_02845 [Spirochaetota bacterium]|nr:hypothetical protein [Spirochaetota bacterium]